MIERGVSADGGPAAMASNRASASENPMNVGRVMDWIEARLEALKAREEEEAEDEARKDAKDEGRRVRSDVGLVAYPDRDADHPLCHPADRASKCTIDAIVPAGACAYSCRQACTSATSAGYALQARPAILDVREPPTAS